jgi:hypothetical protein
MIHANSLIYRFLSDNPSTNSQLLQLFRSCVIQCVVRLGLNNCLKSKKIPLSFTIEMDINYVLENVIAVGFV